MNTLLAVIIGALTVYLAYTLYARRIDRHVIQSDPKRATPATLYMDGVDFMPTNRNILFGYHFKSIAAAGPIIGAIVAANLWGWLPAIIWLILGVSFLGWASDYSGIVISVRNDGNSLSAIAHRLVSPRLPRSIRPSSRNSKPLRCLGCPVMQTSRMILRMPTRSAVGKTSPRVLPVTGSFSRPSQRSHTRLAYRMRNAPSQSLTWKPMGRESRSRPRMTRASDSGDA